MTRHAGGHPHPSVYLARLFLVGAAFGGVIYLFVLSAGQLDVFQVVPGSDRFDDQARSILDGRLDVTPEIATIESFLVDGRAYLYFGLFPALARVPVIAFTDALTGRLGQISLLISASLATWGARNILHEVARLAPSVRALKSPLTKALSFLLGLVFTGGSVVLYLASSGSIYHEAIGWGLAGSLMSVGWSLEFLRCRRHSLMIAAAAAAAISITSRISLGVGAVLFMGAISVACFSDRFRRRASISSDLARKRARILVTSCAVLPVVLFGFVQTAKFGSLSVSPSQHVANENSTSFDLYRSEVGDTFFDWRFVPANIVSLIVWPSDLRFDAELPWLRPKVPSVAPAPGAPRFLGRSWSGSALMTQSYVFALAVIGTMVLCARDKRLNGLVDVSVGRLRILTVALALGSLVTLAYSYQYHRFIADLFPLLIVLACVGVIGWRTRPMSFVTSRRTIGAAAVLVVWSIWINTALALLDQSERAWAAGAAPLERVLTLRLAFGADLEPARVDLLSEFPLPDRTGQTLVVGACDGLYVSAGQDGFSLEWRPVELGARLQRSLEFVGPALPSGESLPFLSDPGDAARVVRIVGSNGVAAVQLVSADREQLLQLGDANVRRFTLSFDPATNLLTVTNPNGDAMTSPWTSALPDSPLDSGTASIRDLGGDSQRLCTRVVGR